MIDLDQYHKLARQITDRLRYYGWIHALANESSIIQEIAQTLRKHDEKVRKPLVDALERVQQDINWMLNNRQFLNGHVFDYIADALAKVDPKSRGYFWFGEGNKYLMALTVPQAKKLIRFMSEKVKGEKQ